MASSSRFQTHSFAKTSSSLTLLRVERTMASSSSSIYAPESTARKSPNDAVSDSRNSIPTLPSDILEEFIARLPLRSLIISSSVCKSWYALLKNPYFASKHFQHTTAHAYFLFRHHQSSRVSLVSSTESFDVPMNFNIPFLQKSKLDLVISGSCNGLVCLSAEYYASIIMLWNPITRVFKALPVSPVKRPDFGPRYVILGFAFDTVANDFKLLRIVYYYDYDGDNQVDIYSLSTNSWREIQSHKECFFYRESMVVVNGRFHWKGCQIVIVSFDFSKEVFTHIQLPNLSGIHLEFDDDDVLDWELVAWKEDFLGVIIYPAYGMDKYIDMWVLDVYDNEKSWTKHFTFGHHMDIHKPLACNSNSEILLYNFNKQLVVYDSGTRTFKIVSVQGIPLCGEVFNYVGSLLPIEGGRTIEEANISAVEPDPFFGGCKHVRCRLC